MDQIEKKRLSILPTSVDKESGYKSIHYLCVQEIGGQNYFIEIQLRTLLQDVWAELEHSLSYKKGNIHPHIKKSFQLLSRDLETNDELISHLKDIADKETYGESFSIKSGGPMDFFDYNADMIPKLFEKGDIKEKFDAYRKFMLAQDPRSNDKSWITKGKDLYNKIQQSIVVTELEESKMNYFIEMEKAFFLFCEGNIDEALKTYKNIRELFDSYYCLFFRMGEIYFIKGQIEKALDSWDKSESIIKEGITDRADMKNRYRIKTKLAYIYWLLGTDYIDFSIKEISEIEAILKSDPDDIDEYRKTRFVNNKCYYLLEKFQITLDPEDLQKTENEIKVLEQRITEKVAPSNHYDTLAWFYYQKFLFYGDYDDLNESKRNCLLIESSENEALYQFLSRNIQRSHVLEIMSTN